MMNKRETSFLRNDFNNLSPLLCNIKSVLYVISALFINRKEKVFQEIQRVIGTENKTATMDDLNQLVYLDRCINETFRLFPSIPWIARKVTKTVILKGELFLNSFIR